MIYFIGDTKLLPKDSIAFPLSINKAINKIQKESLICEDTETRGFDFFKPNILRLIQIGTRKDQFLFDVATCNVEQLALVLEDKNIEKIVANVAFERNMLRSVNIVINNTFDLILAGKVLRMGKKLTRVTTDTGTPFITSLAGLYFAYLGISMDKGSQTSFIHGDAYSNTQLKYAAKDVELYDIYEDIRKRLIKFKLLHSDYSLTAPIKKLAEQGKLSATVLEQKVALYFADMSYNGIFINFPEMLKLYDINIKRRYEIEREMNEYLKSNFMDYSNIRTTPFNVEKVVQTNLFFDDTRVINKRKDKRRVNWNSPLQVKEILRLELGEIPKDKHGTETTSIKALDKEKYLSHSLIEKYMEFKKLSKLISSYGITYKENIHETTGRIHCSVNQILETGRVALKDPNLAQIPGSEEWRLLFTSHRNKTKIVGADYSGQESRVMADKSGDEVFIDFFNNGDGDSHSMVASRVYSVKQGRDVIIKEKSLDIEVKDERDFVLEFMKKEYPKAFILGLKDIKIDGKPYLHIEAVRDEDANPLRQRGKTLNFFISFGGSAFSLSDRMGISLAESKELLDGFWGGFPTLKIYFDKEKKFAIKHGYIIVNNVTNRRRWLPEWKEYRGNKRELESIMKDLIKRFGQVKGKDIYFKKLKEKGDPLRSLNIKTNIMKGDMERAAMNTGIQGTAADMTKTAECLLMEKLEEHGLDLVHRIKPVNHIHDEIMLEVEIGYAELAKKLLGESTREAAEIYTSKLQVPAVPYIADNWKH